MVKRLRRRPLTAKTGVRFPMGLPKKKDGLSRSSFLVCLSREENGGRARRGRLSGERSDASAEGAPARGLIDIRIAWAALVRLFPDSSRSSFLVCLSRKEKGGRAQRGRLSGERSDAPPRGAPARGFGGFPMGGTRSAFSGQFPFFFFGLPLPGREWRTRAARTAFGRAQRRSAEGAPAKKI